jgi:hypothetical protein
MRSILFIFSLIIINLTVSVAQPVTFTWSRSIGGKSTLPGKISMARDSNGDIYVFGQFSGSRSFGSVSLTSSGSSDVFIAKMSAFGPILWAVKGGSSFSSATAGEIVVSGSNIYITGSFSNFISFGTTCATTGSGSNNTDVFIASLNTADGSCNWVVKAEGPNDAVGSSISNATGGGVYVSGTFSGTATFGTFNLNTSGAVDADIFYAKYTSTGTCEWARSLGNLGTETAGSIKEVSSNQIIMNGGYEGSINTPAGNVVSSGAQDFFLTKFNNQGNITWITSGGGPDTDLGISLDVDTAGNIYSAGIMGNNVIFGSISIPIQQNINVLITKHSPNGVCQWVRTGGTMVDDVAQAVCTDPNGSSYVTGYVSGNAAFTTTTGSVNLTGIQGYDSYVVKYNTFGALVWITKIGSPGFEIGKAIIYDAAGNCFNAGEFDGTLSLTANPISAPGGGVYGNYVTKLGGGSVGMGETIAENFKVYPNPASSFVNIDLSPVTDLAFTLELFDVQGRSVKSMLLSESDATDDFRLSTEGLSSGQYLLRLFTSKGDISIPLVISRN